MDRENQNTTVGVIIACAIGFLITGYMTASEALYAVAGREATADVTDATEWTKRGRFGTRRSSRLELKYTFTDHAGRTRTGSDSISPSRLGEVEGGHVKVQYRPGVAGGSSRIAGNSNWIWVVVFFVTGGVLVFFLGRLLMQNRADAARPRKKRKKPRYEEQDDEDDKLARRHI